jgi:hypothetical protein
MAGFNPSAALTFYDKLAQTDTDTRGSLFDTHASPRMRTRIAPALVADSRRYYRNALVASSTPAYAFR